MLLAASVAVSVGRSLREGFFMLWATLWALVLGFGLSGAVQAFVSREEMQRVLGDHRPPAVARATGFGVVSSSCSYAATAMAKSLFQKGADFISSLVFMFASTNLVLELGILLVVLMGWQFAAAEFVGGPIMIVLLVLVASVVLSKSLIDSARQRVRAAAAAGRGDDESAARSEALQRQPWRVRVRSKAGWADASSYTMGDLTMLRRELLIGFVVAGFLSVLVPTHIWSDIFIRGHGIWTSVENAAVGPPLAFVSFVCSVGNVPMAAALWHGHIAFGGVIAFVFADLVSMPLVLIYRRLYGARMALRLFFLFWVVMSAAGLIVEGLFSAAGLEPTRRASQIVVTRFEWNYTTVLNIVFLALLAFLYWIYRNRERLGGGVRFALDQVCGMQVEKANAPATATHAGQTFWFCSDRCRERFVSDPARFLAGYREPMGAMAGSMGGMSGPAEPGPGDPEKAG